MFWEEAFLVLVTMGDVLVGGWGAAAGVVVDDDDDDGADAKAEHGVALPGLPLLLLALPLRLLGPWLLFLATAVLL